MALPSRSKRSLDRAPETLSATDAIETGVAGFVHVAPTGCDGHGKFVWPKDFTEGERHVFDLASLLDHQHIGPEPRATRRFAFQIRIDPIATKQADAPSEGNVSGAPLGESAPWAPSTVNADFSLRRQQLALHGDGVRMTRTLSGAIGGLGT